MTKQMSIPLVAAAVLLVPACNVENPRREREQDAIRLTGGDPNRGKDAIRRYGCLTCHSIPGLPGDANVGPQLDRVGSRVYLGGVLLNTPVNMTRWLKDPPAVDPKTAMPNVGATDDDVKDIACYLYSLR